jgi:gamma-glutamylcysteine synthetase
MRKQTSQKNSVALGWSGNSDGETADHLLQRIFDKLKETTSSLQQENDKFFPTGIELIDFRFKVSPVELEIKVAGAEGEKELLSGNQTLSWEQISSEKNSMEGV